jgi:hypothetical protein
MIAAAALLFLWSPWLNLLGVIFGGAHIYFRQIPTPEISVA